MNRRGLLIGLGALLATPAIVRAASLDYVPRLRPLILCPDPPPLFVGQRYLSDGRFYVAFIGNDGELRWALT